MGKHDHSKDIEQLARELQDGIHSAERNGWISEEESDRMLFDTSMATHYIEPVTYSHAEAWKILDFDRRQ